jgi:pimeloyl-ACP methyl ester carboxylesterase
VSTDKRSTRREKKGIPGAVTVSLHHEERGTGEPILFIHGFGASIFSWRYLVSPLSTNARVIRLDLKGFGASPKPADGDYSIYHQAGLVQRFVLDHDLTNLTIVGHSYGGGIALVTSLSLLDQAPQRLRRLILIDSIGYQQRLPLFIKILRTPIFGPLAVSLVPARLQVLSILKLAYYDSGKITAAAVEEYAKALKTRGGKEALFETAKSLIPPDIDALTREYRRINVPTLILWGEQDRIVPVELGMRLNRDIPDSKLYVLDRCGHIPQEEEPERALTAIKNFLSS